MAKPVLLYPDIFMSATKNCNLFGAIKTFTAPMKTTLRVYGYIQSSCAGSSVALNVSTQCALSYKLNGGTATQLAYGTASSTSTTGADTQQKNFDVSINCSSATKLAFNLTGQNNLTNGTFKAVINIELATVTTEEKITASKLNQFIDIVGSGTKISAGSVIKVANYNTLATATGASSFDSTKPLATNLTALVNAINGKTFSKSWDSTSSSDW